MVRLAVVSFAEVVWKHTRSGYKDEPHLEAKVMIGRTDRGRA